MDIKVPVVTDASDQQSILAQAPFPVAILEGRTLTFTYCNAAYLRLYPQHLLGKSLSEVGDDLRGFPAMGELLDILDTGRTLQITECALINHSDEAQDEQQVRYFNLLYSPVSERKQVSGIMITASEVTENVHTRHQMELAEESARLAIDSAGLGNYEINLLTNEMFTSRRFNSIWGFEHVTTNRNEFASVLHPDDLARRAEAHRISLETGELFYEARIFIKGEQIRWIRVNGKVIRDAQQRPIRLLGVIQDITGEKERAEELTRMVEERTKELKEANEQLEHSNEELAQFAYIASHDLQEPLRKIQMFNTRVLENQELDDNSRKHLEKVTDAAKRMTGLIRDLLEYSSVSPKGQRFAAVDLNVLLRDVLNDFDLKIQQQQATVDIDSLPVVEAIPLHITQLFFNLIGNALKFARPDVPLHISFTSREVDDTRRKEIGKLHDELIYFEIIVSDNGIGFNQAYADKIFTIFQQLHDKKDYGGYGIGLALCKKIVHIHGGHIFARNATDGGAAFHLLLPEKQYATVMRNKQPRPGIR